MKDPTVTGNVAADPGSTRALHEVYRLLNRGDYRGARRAMQRLQPNAAATPYARNLKRKIDDLEAGVKARHQSLRSWRYSLGMNTTWRRICWSAGAVILGIYSLTQFPRAFTYVLDHGIAASITTQVEWRGRYGTSRTIDWTRPIYVDLLYNGLILIAAIAIIVTLIRVSRGASQWEELDSGDHMNGSWYE